MTMLTRWDPFREMNEMRNWMDRFMGDSGFGAPFWREGDGAFSLAVDVAETDDSYEIKASIPGINPDDLEITLEGNMLTIKGQTSQEQEKQDERYFLRERYTGSFRRSIMLPSSVDRDQVEATCENGVLTLRLPKSQKSKPQRIPINQGKTRGAESQSRQVGAVNKGNGSRSQPNGGSQVGRPGASQIAPNDPEARAGGTNRQSQPMTDEQSSSAQSMEGIERPR